MRTAWRQPSPSGSPGGAASGGRRHGRGGGARWPMRLTASWNGAPCDGATTPTRSGAVAIPGRARWSTSGTAASSRPGSAARSPSCTGTAAPWPARLSSRCPTTSSSGRPGGPAREGVRVVTRGRELLLGVPATTAELRRRYSVARRALSPVPLVIEEFVRSEDGSYRLPPELKCHVFGGAVAAVELVERVVSEAHSRRYYTPSWGTFPDPMHTNMPISAVRSRPEGLEPMVALAARIGAELGTYMRIDFFASMGGVFFNEFSIDPRPGTRVHAVLQRAVRRALGRALPGRDLAQLELGHQLAHHPSRTAGPSRARTAIGHRAAGSAGTSGSALRGRSRAGRSAASSTSRACGS